MQTNLIFNNGNTIPVLGLGTWYSRPGLVETAVRYAVNTANYRHIDCASIYRNEEAIGQALAEVINKSVSRGKLFITSKLWNTQHHPDNIENACKKTLTDLKLDYLDLYLVHWAMAFRYGDDLEPLDDRGRVILEPVSIQATWQAMEMLVEKGLVKSIGVANFNTVLLLDLLSYAKIKPAVNQIELHPYNIQKELIDFCHYNHIVVTAYSPLGHPGLNDNPSLNLFNNPVLKELASKYNKSVAQIMLNWGLCRRTVVIPKSTSPDRIMENSQIFDFELLPEDQDKISSLNKNYRFVNPNKWYKIPYFS